MPRPTALSLGWKSNDVRQRRQTGRTGGPSAHDHRSAARDGQQGGLVSTLPTTGSIGAGPDHDFDTTAPSTFDQDQYAAAHTHDGEVGDAATTGPT
ncbi:hypothetical protein [Saccharopolyspora hordei]|uniref:Uncharacterized protein n=1 Tax=Saccharopolyspora hordei TaxID=1838 RepID=A0A853ARA6_9PSEU|nr:hypothetical protein [Saccharopolyspora hordei]NYI83790.1 hypothetical protein [Saccharopolyspora hordei]